MVNKKQNKNQQNKTTTTKIRFTSPYIIFYISLVVRTSMDEINIGWISKLRTMLSVMKMRWLFLSIQKKVWTAHHMNVKIRWDNDFETPIKIQANPTL